MFNYLCANPQYAVLEADDPEVEGWKNLVVERMKSGVAMRASRTRLSCGGRERSEKH